MSAKKQKSPLVLDMDFDEALKRFANADPEEMREEANSEPKKSRNVKLKCKEGLPESPC